MFKKLKHNKNYKLIIGLIIGFFVSSTVVSALYLGTASELSYDPSNTWLTSTTVQGALDELYYRKGCPLGYICLQKKTTLEPGDYISYTPSKTSYTTDTSMTGNDSTQTINPSELTLWRVLSINQDGTIDIISDNVSSIEIYFAGKTGYQNYVGYLNVLASQYETSGITVGSRYFGYDGQTEFITDTTYFTTSPPFGCSTGGTCSPDPDDYEPYGGGDKKYSTDYNLVTSVLGTAKATKINKQSSLYFIASRYYLYGGSSTYIMIGRRVGVNGGVGEGELFNYDSGRLHSSSSLASLRPIVTLKSGLTYSGVGTEDYPMEIQQ